MRCGVMVLLLHSLAAIGAFAQSAASGSGERSGPLRVATKLSEPFVIRFDDGSLGGLSIDLLDRIAGQLDVEYELVMRDDVEGVISAVVGGEVDAGVAALSVTPEREERLDFSHAYFMSGLGIATKGGRGRGGGLLRGMLALLTPGFWIAVGSLGLVLLLVGVAAWFAERKGNPDEFGGGVVKGIGNGFWFSAVTMTTVGYGDKSPRSAPGRFIALVWMFTSIIIISTFTGTIASSITSASLDTGVRGPEDLPGVRVGAMEGASSREGLNERGVSARWYASVGEGLEALRNGEIDAFVHDAPILAYAIKENATGGLRLLESRFHLRPYAIAVPERSPVLEPLNRALLEATVGPEWRSIVSGYVGD